MEEITFDFDKDDLEPKSKPVRYKGKDYVLREAGNAAVVAYRNATSKATKLVDGKLSGFDGLADAEPLLIAKCLFEVTAPGKEGAVSPGFVAGMPNRYVKPMFDWIVEHSDIQERATADSIRKEIASLEKKLAEMEAETGGPKGEPSSTGTTSSSPGN